MARCACCGLRERGSLWITLVGLAVDYGLRPVDYTCWRMLWITGFALWISQRFVLGRIYPLAAHAVDYGPVGPVDYAPAVLWITMLRICGLVD